MMVVITWHIYALDGRCSSSSCCCCCCCRTRITSNRTIVVIVLLLKKIRIRGSGCGGDVVVTMIGHGRGNGQIGNTILWTGINVALLLWR